MASLFHETSTSLGVSLLDFPSLRLPLSFACWPQIGELLTFNPALRIFLFFFFLGVQMRLLLSFFALHLRGRTCSILFFFVVASVRFDSGQMLFQ